MKVVLYGATGMIGSRILAELIARGHSVTAVVRNTAKVPSLAGVLPLQGDMLDPESVCATARGADAAISAFSPGVEAPEQTLTTAFKSLMKGLKEAGVSRVIVVGGAGSLEVAPGLQLVDTPNFPREWKSIAEAHRDAVQALRESDLDWTVLSPSAMIAPGVKTGKFRLGTDQLIADEKGESRISAEDYSAALVDELERPQHLRRRFTVGY